MTTDVDAALAKLGLTRADLPPAVADTVARHLEVNEPGMDDLLRAERGAIPDRRRAAANRIFFGAPDADQPDPDPT